MKFVADDGKVFDTMEECEKYEANNGQYGEIARIFYDEIIMYDKQGLQIEPQNEPTTSLEYLSEIEDILGTDCYYIIIPNYINWSEIRTFLHQEYGLVDLPPTTGEWHWNDSKSYWESYKEMCDHFNDVWGRIGKPRIKEDA